MCICKSKYVASFWWLRSNQRIQELGQLHRDKPEFSAFLLLTCMCPYTKRRESKNKTMATTLGLLVTTPNPHKKSLQIYSSSSSSLPKHLPTSSLPSHKDPSHDLLQNLHKSISHLTLSSLPTAAALTLPFLLAPQEALAVDGEFGLLEGRSFALVHPLVMTGLFFYTLRAGYLGWQWRRVRTVQEEINELKKQVKPTPVAAGAEGASQAPPPQSPVELKIQELTEVLNS